MPLSDTKRRITLSNNECDILGGFLTRPLAGLIGLALINTGSVSGYFEQLSSFHSPQKMISITKSIGILVEISTRALVLRMIV